MSSRWSEGAALVADQASCLHMPTQSRGHGTRGDGAVREGVRAPCPRKGPWVSHGTRGRWGCSEKGVGPPCPLQSSVGMAPEPAIVLPTQRTPASQHGCHAHGILRGHAGDETALPGTGSCGGPQQQVPRLLELLPLWQRLWQRLANDGGVAKVEKPLIFPDSQVNDARKRAEVELRTSAPGHLPKPFRRRRSARADTHETVRCGPGSKRAGFG